MSHLQLKSLASTPLLQIVDVSCTAPRSGWSGDEGASLPRLVLPRRGLFGWQTGGERHLIEAGCLLLLESDDSYRFSHPTDGGDDCTLISLVPDLWRETVGTRTLQQRSVRLPSVAQYQCALFYRIVSRHAHDALALEELGIQLASTLLELLVNQPDRTPPLLGPRAADRHRQLAEAAAACVAASYRSHDGLAAIARQVHSSPFQLARVFREQTGITLHRYRGRLRLAAALTALGEGCDDLTDLALRLGYASHSHFSDSFRATFGCSPSAARALLTRATLAQMRKILEAAPAARA